MPSMFGFSTLSLTLALSVTGVIAHPLFNGHLVQRADVLPSYDYVVVGAGASGLTVASRLSEQPNVTVLLIEAGDFDQNEDYTTIPALAGGAVGTKYDWNTTYAADTGVGGRSVSIPQGRVVGGSTKLNRMVYDRGSQSDYDGWATLGNKGWNFAGLLPYFKKNEKFTPPTAAIAAEYDIKIDTQNYGSTGPMQTTFAPFFWPTTMNIVRATKGLGIPINDQATGKAFGGYFCPHNQDPTNSTRQSSEEAYYSASVAQRSNLHLLAGNQVTKIITSTTNGAVKVTGVEYANSKDAPRQSVKVAQEAILAAGSLHTPQILQVSGIGAASLLKSINVTTVVDLPAVGHNLHDHISTFVVNTINTTLLTNTLTSNATFAAEARAQYDAEKSGPLTTPTADFLLFLPLSTYSNASAAIASQAASAKSSVSLPADVPAEVAKGYEAQYSLLNKKLTATDSAMMEVIFDNGVMVMALQHPYSRGSVKATSSSTFDAPISDLGILRNPLDVTLIREGVRWVRKLAQTPEIGELQPFEVVPGASVESDADIDTWIRGGAASLFHPAGTSKMGARADGGVVDTSLKVYGVSNLRVVDLSVIPILPATHTMTTAYAVAEKAADIIKGSKAYKAKCKA